MKIDVQTEKVRGNAKIAIQNEQGKQHQRLKPYLFATFFSFFIVSHIQVCKTGSERGYFKDDKKQRKNQRDGCIAKDASTVIDKRVG